MPCESAVLIPAVELYRSKLRAFQAADAVDDGQQVLRRLIEGLPLRRVVDDRCGQVVAHVVLRDVDVPGWQPVRQVLQIELVPSSRALIVTPESVLIPSESLIRIESWHGRSTGVVITQPPTDIGTAWPSLTTHAATSFSSSKRRRTRTTTTPAEGPASGASAVQPSLPRSVALRETVGVVRLGQLWPR